MSITPGVYVVEHKTTGFEIKPGATYWMRLAIDAQIDQYDDGARSLGHEPRGILYDVIHKPQLRPLKATPTEERKYTQPSSRACKECKKKNPSPGPHLETVGEGEEARDIACEDGRIVTDPGGRLYKGQREADETPEEFALRIRADIGEEPDKYFQRGVVVRFDEERRDAAVDTWLTANAIRQLQLRQAEYVKAARPTERAWPRNPDACDSYGSFCQYFPVCSGEADIEDPTRYRDAEQPHEELSAALAESKRRLPLLSASSMKAFRSCPRKYFYSYERRRRSIVESDALRFGTLMHKGLEAWWKTVSLDEALAAMAGEADPFERVKAEELMRGYHVRWLNEPIEVLAVEQEFVSPLVNPESGRESQTWQRGGKIDALVRVGAATAEAAA